MTAVSAASSTLERRRDRRVPVNLPMLLRGTDRQGDPFEERTLSINICRGGAAFQSRRALGLGDRLEIKISNFRANDSNGEFATQGRIVYIAPGRTDRESLIGVAFTGPRFHRMFVSEESS